MTITVTWQTIILAGSILGALSAIIAYIVKAVRWWDRQNKQDVDIAALKTKHEKDIETLRKDVNEELIQQRAEMQLIIYGVLASLKGLSEQGCNGPVTDAINKIEKYLNVKAHNNERSSLT